MKKIYLLLFAGLLSFAGQAQNQTEYHLGIGTGSVQELAVRNGVHPLFNVAITSSETPKRTYSVAGPVRFGIKRHEGKHFLIGAEFNYTNIEVQNTYSTGVTDFTNFAHYTVMASTQYKFIDNPKFTLYSGVDFGVSFSQAKNQSTNRKIQDLTGAFQVNCLGARYGSKLGVFGELGYGFNGFLSGGIFYRVD